MLHRESFERGAHLQFDEGGVLFLRDGKSELPKQRADVYSLRSAGTVCVASSASEASASEALRHATCYQPGTFLPKPRRSPGPPLQRHLSDYMASQRGAQRLLEL